MHNGSVSTHFISYCSKTNLQHTCKFTRPENKDPWQGDKSPKIQAKLQTRKIGTKLWAPMTSMFDFVKAPWGKNVKRSCDASSIVNLWKPWFKSATVKRSEFQKLCRSSRGVDIENETVWPPLPWVWCPNSFEYYRSLFSPKSWCCGSIPCHFEILTALLLPVN